MLPKLKKNVKIIKASIKHIFIFKSMKKKTLLEIVIERNDLLFLSKLIHFSNILSCFSK